MLAFSPRALRARHHALSGPPEPSGFEVEETNRLLDLATPLLAACPPCTVTFPALAHALGVSLALLRRLFSDMDGLIGALLARHLHEVADALETAAAAPAARAAYRAATRMPDGVLTAPHRILAAHTATLPPDLRAALKDQHTSIGERLAPGHAEIALALLDSPALPPARAEATLAFLTQQQEQVESVSPPVPSKPAAPSRPRRVEPPRLDLPFSKPVRPRLQPQTIPFTPEDFRAFCREMAVLRPP